MIARLSVVSLVIAASFAGIAHTQSQGVADASPQTGFLSLISSVRGAAADQQLSTTYYDLDALGEEQAAIVDRGAPAVLPGQQEPMPTPVPVDPDATPLAAPTGIGSTSGSGGLTTRARGPIVSAALLWPVAGGSVSQYFHAGHLALDIAAPYGNQVMAAQAGTVAWAGWRNNGGGNVITIDHGNGMKTVYNHLGSIWVSPGQFVAAGQGIGGVGCTGMCTGPHVHFEVIVNGVIDNPLRYL
jgi:murein DD-endopeptidase MepM/ murein hydrolase activator NlpD